MIVSSPATVPMMPSTSDASSARATGMAPRRRRAHQHQVAGVLDAPGELAQDRAKRAAAVRAGRCPAWRTEGGRRRRASARVPARRDRARSSTAWRGSRGARAAPRSRPGWTGTRRARGPAAPAAAVVSCWASCTDSANACTNASTDAASTVSGGVQRTTFPPASVVRNPRRSSARMTADAVAAGATGTPTSRPRPRGDVVEPRLAERLRQAGAQALAHRRRVRQQSSSSMTSSTASAPAQGTGPPPNVEPWSPGPNARSSRAMAAPIGRPFASAFASVNTSGVTSTPWNANHVPVRPTPVCTSSNSSRAPRSSHSRRASAGTRRQRDHAAFAEHGLEQHRGRRVVDRRRQRVGVAGRDVDEALGQRLERHVLLRMPGRGQRRERPAVERAVQRDDLHAALRGAPTARDLQRRLVRLRARVAQEHAAEPGQRRQPVRQPLLRDRREQVADVRRA